MNQVLPNLLLTNWVRFLKQNRHEIYIVFFIR